jgi:hypothetical protein
VESAQRQRRRVAEPHLVEDAPGLLVGAGVDLLALEAGEGLEDAEGEVGVDDQRHPRGDERVAPEQRHEPRRPCGDDDPVGVVGVEDAQGPEVLGAAVHDGAKALVVGVELRRLGPPARQALDGGRPLDGMPAQVAGLDLLGLDDGRDLHTRAPGALGRHDHLEQDDVAGDPRLVGEGDDRAPAGAAPAVAERDAGAADLHAVLAVVELRASLLDLEQVGEVGLHDVLE